MASVNGHSQIDEQSEVTLTHSDSCLSVHHAHKEPQKEPQILTLYPQKEPQKEPQILTLYPTNTESDAAHTPNCHRLNTLLSSGWEYNSKKGTTTTPWNDTLLKKRDGKNQTCDHILWLPGSGRHVSEGPDSYQPFTHITRTIHLEDALDVCTYWRIPPKNIITFSSMDSRSLPPGHPCGDLRVLWFSAQVSTEEEDKHDWYGNVEFSVSASVLLENWKYSFLVEMMSAPTHTVSRILLTNTDYSGVLRPYNPFCGGGPWQVSAEGQLALQKCSRYKFKGTNRHPHVLEFLLDVNKKTEKKILQECELSFKNHEDAQDLTVSHVCNRHQRLKTVCPTPFPPTLTANVFAARLQLMNRDFNSIPKLSSSAQQFYRMSSAKLVPVPIIVFENPVIPHYNYSANIY